MKYNHDDDDDDDDQPYVPESRQLECTLL